MAPLAERLRALIAADGPISVENYMALANAHYYATRDPLGTAGDFTTAPEISQMFGELIGAALADCWLRAASAAGVRLVELGPGRGTLARDALRAMAAAGLEPAIELIETSPRLREEQQRLLPQASWHTDLATVGGGPLLIIANEFLDALPVRQWCGSTERRVTVAGDRFAFVPAGGPIREDSPVRDAAVAAIAERLVAQGGCALLIDYGHERSALGDSLQAVRGHRFADPLAEPGEQDLTAHVDFEAVARVARIAGAQVGGPVRQGEWLVRLGIDARAERLAAQHPDQRDSINAARARLCGREEMGALFKVIALAAPGWPLPAGLEH